MDRCLSCPTQVNSELSGIDDAVLLVDVGGNKGDDLKAFRDRFPELRGRLLLQGLPEVISKLPPIGGIEKMVYDFLAPQFVQGELSFSYFLNPLSL